MTTILIILYCTGFTAMGTFILGFCRGRGRSWSFTLYSCLILSWVWPLVLLLMIASWLYDPGVSYGEFVRRCVDG